MQWEKWTKMESEKGEYKLGSVRSNADIIFEYHC